ncbi:MAG: c-type cytochrome [Rhodobacteraceae bacterium]|nr:c-type cytochrome [Paracoccaceae bacterium]
MIAGLLLAGTAVNAEGLSKDPRDIAIGKELAETQCSRCHAVGVDDESVLDEAPAFRDLAKHYPLEALEESLAEGIVTAHEDMPEFSFASKDVTALLAYLGSIQDH